MEQLIRILIRRLVGKGMEISTIPAYIRDLANTMVANGYSSLEELNSHPQLLGWDDFELDDHTLRLIIARFEPDLAYKPPHWFERTFNPKGRHKLADEEEYVPTRQIGPHKPLKA